MLIAHAAANEGIDPATMPFGKLLREMVVRGTVPTDIRVAIGTALERRSQILHAAADDPSRQDIDEMVDLLTRLDQEIVADAVV